jgi:NAD(P)-dependent dehydrogenase (short-subunit alcohol dehydrogenase family)
MLRGKGALVTGASRGIGRAIALAYAGAGAEVALLARSAAELDALAEEIAAFGGRAIALACDVTKPEEIGAAVGRAIEGLGHIDVLVNNAGGPVFNAPFLEIRADGWRRVLDLNLMSVVSFCQAVGAHMVDRRTVSVINVDSMGAAHPAPMVTPYCAAKAAVVSLTQALALEWAAANVRVNAVAPGWIRTHINRAFSDDAELEARVAEQVPLGRWGEPADLVGVALWLASDASAYVTGTHIPIDGGIDVVAPQSFPARGSGR